MWQFDSTIGLMVWEEVFSCLQEVLSRSDISTCQDFSCPPCLFLDSRRTWIFLIDLEMVSRWEETFIRSICESFIKIWHHEPCQDSTCTPSLFLESWRIMDILDGPGDCVRWEGTTICSVCESFIKIWHQEPYEDFSCPPCLFLESRRTILIDLLISNRSYFGYFIKIWH